MAVANTSSFFLVVNSYYNDTQLDPVPHTDEGLQLYTETFYKYLSFSNGEILSDCSKKDFLSVFIDFLQRKVPHTTKYFAFIFLGHGREGHLFMNDGQPVSIQGIIDEINKVVPEQVSKLFIINACRENEQLMLPKTPNSIYIYATLPGRKAIPAWSKYFNDEMRTNAGDLDAVCFSACAKMKEYLNSNIEPSQYISNGLSAPKLLQRDGLEIPDAISGRLIAYSQLMEQHRVRDPSFRNVGQQPLSAPEAGGSKVVDDKKLRQEVKPRITDLQNVADSKAVRKWKAICRELGVTEDEIAQAETAHIAASTGPSEAFMEALLNWRDKNGHEAKVSVLASVLEKCGCKEVATQLKKNAPDVQMRVTPVQLQDVADSEAVNKWQAKCRYLGVNENVIVQAETTHVSASAGEAFMEALKAWFDHGEEVILPVLIDVLEKFDFNDVATKIGSTST